MSDKPIFRDINSENLPSGLRVTFWDAAPESGIDCDRIHISIYGNPMISFFIPASDAKKLSAAINSVIQESAERKK